MNANSACKCVAYNGDGSILRDSDHDVTCSPTSTDDIHTARGRPVVFNILNRCPLSFELIKRLPPTSATRCKQPLNRR